MSSIINKIIDTLDKPLAIFGIALICVAPENQRKWGFAFIVTALLLYILGFVPKEKRTRWGIVVLVLSTSILVGMTIFEFVSEKNSICPFVSLTDKSFEMDRMDKALLYNDTTKEIPIWFKKEDLEYNDFRFVVNNTGTTFADIIDTQFIVDDYKPITTEDILLLKEWGIYKPSMGLPPTAKASIDLSNIANGQSKFNADFFEYKDYENHVEMSLRDGQSFNVDPTSQTELIIYPKLNKSGVYTYHLKIDFEYDRKQYPMETDTVSFIYVDDDLNNYGYNNDKLDSLELDREYYDTERDKYIYYTISGHTLRVHDTEVIYSGTDLERYLPFIDTIVVEEGTKRIEENAFYFKPVSKDNKTLYLPKSLEYIDRSSFDKTYFNKIYYAGTKEQWDSLNNNLDGNSLENIEDNIYYEY